MRKDVLGNERRTSGGRRRKEVIGAGGRSAGGVIVRNATKLSNYPWGRCVKTMMKKTDVDAGR